MDKVIEEIKQAEEQAEAKVNAAKVKAEEIARSVASKEEELKAKYERRLKEEAAAAVASQREEIAALGAEETKNADTRRNELRQIAQDKIQSCADYVINYIFKEFT